MKLSICSSSSCCNLSNLIFSPMRAKQIQRSLNNMKLTLLCGFLTLLVLRGTLGAGKFGTPAKDLEEIKQRFGSRRSRIGHSHHKKHLMLPSRALAQANLAEEPTNPIHHGQDHDHGTLTLTNLLHPYNAHLLPHAYNNPSTTHPNIMLVTSDFDPPQCDTPLAHHFQLLSLNNKLDYCRLHGIRFSDISASLPNADDVISSATLTLNKPTLLRSIMVDHPEVEWFWWMDHDAVFTRLAFELPMHKYEYHNMVLQGDWEKVLPEGKTPIGLNIGCFLIRNRPWSLDLLDAWATLNGSPEKLLGQSSTSTPDHRDQSTLLHLLTGEKKNKWGEKVYMENSYQLHGTRPILVDNYEDITLEKSSKNWPFVIRFIGCKPCSEGVDDHNDDDMPCFKQMQRAFDFAENQLLEHYGSHHPL